MRVLAYHPIGYQKVFFDDGELVCIQLRFACKVEPIGSFVEDPDGSVTEIKEIDPKDYKQYFDWQTIGDHIINRALEFKETF